MAKRRMFSTEFLQSDNFSDLPFSCQVLYFNLMANADDDGFISGPRRIMRGCNCAEEDLKYLVKAGFIFVFDSGIVVIRHWLIHNHIRKDRHTETVHTEEKAQLELKNGVYAWREDAEKKQNTGAEKAKPALKSDVYVCREDMEEKTPGSVEKAVTEINKDAHACREIADEKLIVPKEKSQSEIFCFPKEWENIAENPQVIENDEPDSQRQEQPIISASTCPAECFFEDTELNNLFTDFLSLREKSGCRDITQLIQLLVIELNAYTTEQQKKILRDALYHKRKDLYPWEITKQMAEDASFTPDGWIKSLSDVPDGPDDLDYSEKTCNICENMSAGFVRAGDILRKQGFWT